MAVVKKTVLVLCFILTFCAASGFFPSGESPMAKAVESTSWRHGKKEENALWTFLCGFYTLGNFSKGDTESDILFTIQSS